MRQTKSAVRRDAGQQRDTARLAVISADEQEVRLTLTDDMDDVLFDCPLTVKLRLPSTWNKCSARQNGRIVPVQIVEHNGTKFALAQVVPDRGELALRPTSTPQEGG